MYENRATTKIRKPRIILNKSFSVADEIGINDGGLMALEGIIEAERKEILDDGTERIVRTIRIETAELIKTNEVRIQK